jgi:hypothetical protein
MFPRRHHFLTPVEVADKVVEVEGMKMSHPTMIQWPNPIVEPKMANVDVKSSSWMNLTCKIID